MINEKIEKINAWNRNEFYTQNYSLLIRIAV